jgi:CheY-like chemotaxis protein
VVVESEPAPRRLLVVEGDAAYQARLLQALSSSGFELDAAGSAAQALPLAQAHAYTGIELGLLLPDQSGLGLLAAIRSSGASRASPVLGVSMQADASAAASFQVSDVLCKPIRTDEVVLAMARFRSQGESRTRVLVIDDDPLSLDLMRATLAGLGIAATGVQDGREALRDIDRHQPAAIVLDLMMPGFDGFAVLDALRRLPAWRDTPVFIWTSMILSSTEVESLARSARAILGKGGGALEPLRESLRQWRPPAVVTTDRS